VAARLIGIAMLGTVIAYELNRSRQAVQSRPPI